MAVDGSLNFDTQINPDGFNRGTKKLTSSVKKLGTILAAVFGAGIIKIASDFEYAMAEVQASTEAVGESFEALIDKAKEMGKTTKFTATESANAMKFMGLAGWSTTQIIEGLADVMDLSAASGEDLSLISDIVTDSMTALGISAKKTGEFVDLLAAASSNSNSTIALFGESFKYASNIAGALGVTARDTAFALGLMANSGVKASMSGTALRTTLTKLNNPVGKTKDVMERFGIKVARNDDLSLNFGETIINLRKSFGKMNKQQKSVNAELLVGRIAMGGLLGIVNASEESYDKLTLALDNMTGKAKEMAEIKLNTLRGQLDLLKSAFSGVALEIGEVLIPIFKTLIKGFIIPAVAWFSELIAQLKQFYTAMGITTKKQIAQSTSVTQSIVDNEKAQEGVTGAVEDTNEALKSSLAGFDEVNVLQKEAKENAEEGIGADLGITVGTAQTPELEIDEKKIGEEIEISPNVQRIIDLLKPLTEIDFTPLKTALLEVKTSLEGLGELNLDYLSWLYSNVLVPLATWTIEDFIPVFLELLASTIDILTATLEVFKPLGSWLWEEFLKPLGEWGGGIIVSILELLTEQFQKLAEWISKNQELVQNILLVLGILAVTFKVVTGAIALFNTILPIATVLIEIIGGALAFLTSPIGLVILAIGLLTAAFVYLYKNNEDFRTKVLGIWENIKTVAESIWGSIKKLLLSVWENVIKPILLPAFTKIKDTVLEVFPIIADNITTAFGDIIEIIKFLWNNYLKPFIDYISDEIIPLVRPSMEAIGKIFGDIFESVIKIIGNVTQIFKGLIKFIKGVFLGDWSEAWEGVSDVFGGIFKGLINIVRSPLNVIIRMINSFLDYISSIKINIPEVDIPGIGKVGGGSIGFPNIPNIPEIPALATGTVVPPNSKFLAMLGDNKQEHEIVSPISTMKQAVLEALEESGSNNVTIVVEEKRGLAKFLKFEIDKENARQGRSKVVTGGAF